jgi:plastocyanin
LEQSVDQDVGPGQRVEVELTFPRSGAVAFFCGYHSSERMRGGLEVS